MSAQVERRAAPSLMGNQRSGDNGGPVLPPPAPPSLLELMHEGFYMLFLLKNGAKPPHEAGVLSLHAKVAPQPGTTAPPSKDELEQTALLDENILKEKVDFFLAEFDREAQKLRISTDDISAAKYAFCAALDEIVLNSGMNMWNQWQRRPLQLVLFGDQLAGDQFYRRLEELRSRGGAHVQALEVFHMCLLLGFRGRHMHEGRDKIDYVTARLGDEIAHIKGKSKGFAPRAERPDQVINKLRSDMPVWALSAFFAVVGLGAYLGMRSSLVHETQNSMAGYADLVRLAPTPASVTITLP